jgi:hypothetical protein
MQPSKNDPSPRNRNKPDEQNRLIWTAASLPEFALKVVQNGGDARRLRHGASSDACMLGAERGSWAGSKSVEGGWARSSVAGAGPIQHP